MLACLTVATDEVAPQGGACATQSTGGGAIGSRVAETMPYFLSAGEHTLHFYGYANVPVTGTVAISNLWLTVTQP